MSTRWARVTIAALEAGGVTDIIVCPGSRSAPLAVAAAASGARVTSIVDERSAAFYALGQARASGRPSAVICTSGTAGAHFYPAIIEASMAGEPLIVITADRPPELQRCGAPQTIDQRGLYAGFVRAEIDLGCAREGTAAEIEHAARVHDAVMTARGPHPGPVHLNAPARKPLLEDDGQPLATITNMLAKRPSDVAIMAPDADRLLEARALLARAERPLIVAGPIAARMGGSALVALAEHLQAPLLAEPASGARYVGPRSATSISCYDEVLRATGFHGPLAPDLILEIGAPPTSAGYARALTSDGDITRLLLRPHLHQDPQGSAHLEIIGDLGHSIAALMNASDGGAIPASRQRFVARWRDADADAAARVEEALAGEPMTGQAAARCVLGRLPPDAQLALGNSLVIRWVDQACPAGVVTASVLHQRGASGIDGLVASAAGAAMATSTPTCLLLGDVSMAHDIGSLAVAAGVTTPLVVCVLDNGGGQIFSELPYARDLDGETRRDLFLTPPALDVTAAAGAYGVRSLAVCDVTTLAAAVDDAISRTTTTIIVARVAERSRPVL